MEKSHPIRDRINKWIDVNKSSRNESMAVLAALAIALRDGRITLIEKANIIHKLEELARSLNNAEDD